jgi:hypothetical protein
MFIGRESSRHFGFPRRGTWPRHHSRSLSVWDTSLLLPSCRAGLCTRAGSSVMPEAVSRWCRAQSGEARLRMATAESTRLQDACRRVFVAVQKGRAAVTWSDWSGWIWLVDWIIFDWWRGWIRTRLFSTVSTRHARHEQPTISVCGEPEVRQYCLLCVSNVGHVARFWLGSIGRLVYSQQQIMRLVVACVYGRWVIILQVVSSTNHMLMPIVRWRLKARR